MKAMDDNKTASDENLGDEQRRSLHVGIPNSLLRRAKACAAMEDREVADVVAAALARYLDAHEVVEGSGNIMLR
jgi:hypothetical protein